MYPRCLHVSRMFTCIHDVYMYLKCLHVSKMFTCIHDVYMYLECLHVSKMFTCIHDVYMYPRCLHVYTMFTCIHDVYMYADYNLFSGCGWDGNVALWILDTITQETFLYMIDNGKLLSKETPLQTLQLPELIMRVPQVLYLIKVKSQTPPIYREYSHVHVHNNIYFNSNIQCL